eukprot:Selendium_serpulae@DN1974_c0_g1_i2.p1
MEFRKSLRSSSSPQGGIGHLLSHAMSLSRSKEPGLRIEQSIAHEPHATRVEPNEEHGPPPSSPMEGEVEGAKAHLTTRPLNQNSHSFVAPVMSRLTSSPSSDQLQTPQSPRAVEQHVKISIKGTNFLETLNLGHALTDLKAGIEWRGQEHHLAAPIDQIAASPASLGLKRNEKDDSHLTIVLFDVNHDEHDDITVWGKVQIDLNAIKDGFFSEWMELKDCEVGPPVGANSVHVEIETDSTPGGALQGGDSGVLAWMGAIGSRLQPRFSRG